MSEEDAEAAAAAPAQNSRFFTGSITKFERPKFNPRIENRPEALRPFKKKGGYIFLYYYMRNFWNLIGLEQWYFSLIWNTYMWKLQTFCG